LMGCCVWLKCGPSTTQMFPRGTVMGVF